jgi:hypothetical protein
MGRVLLAYGVCCFIANAANVSYRLTEGASYCQEIQIPKWTKPPELPSNHFDFSFCRFDFRSPAASPTIYLGLSCEWEFAERRSPEKFLLAPRPSRKLELIDQAAWEGAEVLFPVYPPDVSSPSWSAQPRGTPKTGQ